MADKTPEVGMGATLIYPSDRYPYRIVRVVSPTTFDMARLDSGSGPAEYSHNGFPVHDRVIDPSGPLAPGWETNPTRVRLTKRGWSATGTPVSLGLARYRRDWSD